MPLAVRIASALFALLFAFGAVVQWNDPDPLRWMLAYGVSAGVSAAAAADRLAWPAPAILLAGLGTWLAMWSPAFAHASLDAARSFGMSGAASEEEFREASGLALQVGWAAALLVFAWCRRAD